MTEEPQPCFHLDKAYVMRAASCQPFGTHAAREENGIFGVAAGVSIAHFGQRFEAENPGAGGKQPGPGEPAALLGGGAAPPAADARSPPGGTARRSPLSAPAFPSKGRRPHRRHRPHRLASRAELHCDPAKASYLPGTESNGAATSMGAVGVLLASA